jgi:integrase/recombinase XerD
LCSLKDTDVDLSEKSILVYGKGAKERSLPIGSADVVLALQKYRDAFSTSIQKSNCFYINLNGTPVSDQSIRRMIRKYCTLAAIDLHITPHMFRHTFATSLLEADVDIRYIQNMLGHSSINTTQIYTHVSQSKQRDILSTKHPRNQFDI